jgi:D-glycero-alpha-D-manno-heptose-7-phosphate kinase
MAYDGGSILQDNRRPLSEFGNLLHLAWMEKRAGAHRGKLLGAGGGGLIPVFAPPAQQAAVRAALAKLTYVPFNTERERTSILARRPCLSMSRHFRRRRQWRKLKPWPAKAIGLYVI